MATNPTTVGLTQRTANPPSAGNTAQQKTKEGQRHTAANSKDKNPAPPQGSDSSPKSKKVAFSAKNTSQPSKTSTASARTPGVGEQILTGVGNTLKEAALAPLKTLKYVAWDAPRTLGRVLGSFAVGSGATGANPFDKHDAQKDFVAQVTPKPGRPADVVKNTVYGESGALALSQGRTAEARASAATNLLLMGIPGGSKGIPGRKLPSPSLRPPANPPKAPASSMELVPAMANSAPSNTGLLQRPKVQTPPQQRVVQPEQPLKVESGGGKGVGKGEVPNIPEGASSALQADLAAKMEVEGRSSAVDEAAERIIKEKVVKDTTEDNAEQFPF
jgi:hypothetical protein